MKYETSVEDVHKDWHNGPDVDAATPTEAFRLVLDWVEAENIMPEVIFVVPWGAADGA